MAKFLGEAYGCGCGQEEKVLLCVEACSETQARETMETIMMSRYPLSNVDCVRTATEEEARTLPIDKPNDPD